MSENALDSAFGDLLHLNLIEEFERSGGTWTRARLAKAYEHALVNTMRDGAPLPPEGSLEATILGLNATDRAARLTALRQAYPPA